MEDGHKEKEGIWNRLLNKVGWTKEKLQTDLEEELQAADLQSSEVFKDELAKVKIPRETEMEGPVICFSELEKVLKNVIADLEISQSTDTRRSATCRVNNAINSFCKTLEEGGDCELLMLLQILMKLVGYKGGTFSSTLDCEETKFLLSKLSEVHERYSILKKRSLLKVHAYVVLTVLTVRYNVNSFDKQEILDDYLNKNAAVPPQIHAHINECNKNWILLEEKLKSLIEENTEEQKENPQLQESITVEETCLTEQMLCVMAECENQQLNSPAVMVSELPKAYKTLLLDLDLWKLYPHKITVSDLLSTTTLSLNGNPTTDSELWPYFVSKLMMVDVNCRYVHCENVDEKCTIKDTNTEDFFSFGEETNETAYEKTHIHPMDVYMAVFHCTDDLAKERIIHKISACQFALPLLVPNLLTGQIEVPLYALQQIKKSWVKTQSGRNENVSAFILSAPVPVVSFLRLGMSINSKSQIMNAILNRNKHPTFFNRHCDGSTKTCLLLDGVAEVSWYCPNGRKDNIFQECVCFINLHGDANKHPRQLEFIQGISSVMVVLLPEKHREPEIVESVKRLQETKVPMVLLFTGVEHRSSSSGNQIAAKNRNEAELTKEIVSKVTHVLHEKKVVQSLESHIDKARQRGLIVNKESKEICNGQERAKHLIAILGINNKPQGNYNNLLGLKDKYLPLQGDLWNEWSKCDKNVYRLQCRTDMNINQQMTKVESKKNKIRKNQLEKADNLNNFMAQFFKYALPSTDTSEKIAMLNWLKKYLDDRYTDILTDLHEQFHETWTNMRQHEAEEKSKAELNNHLTDISGKIKSASFEVHHIMRETAQIYEAIHSSGEFRTVCGFELDSLPELGAEIMMSGCPIELLDGDAKHIPLEWISAVLEKLIHKIGDQRVFVISTLGLQSSGKSTLLNAMFGLQFAASAGQCTKGAFMQLVSVHEDLRDDLHFDYVLLVDTEGLRSLETNASKTHDNELATFVVGIGDVTIINIMGENPAEIQDTLQICFHAFLRMTLVQIKPCCFFVHQNIADTAAKNKTQEGRRQLILKLDEISKLVAAAEDKEVNGFSDIIEFDAETHVFYFKNCFDGDPPMAPPNPSYTQNAHELKTKLLSIAKWQDNCKLLLISEVRTRIQHLWNALKKENFVFHFQNSLHIMVYSKLEEHYGKWSWKLRKYALEMQNTLHYKISSDESYDTSTEQFRQDQIYQGLKGDVDRYFREEKYPDILVQWRDNIDKRLESLNKELIKETSDKNQELLNNKKYFLKLDQRRHVYEAELLQKSKDLASKLKEEKLNEEELHAHFNTMWTEWETKVAAEKPQEEPRNIQAEVEKVLQGYFQKYWERIFPVKEILCSNVADIVNYSNKIYSKQQVPETVKLVFQRVQEGINNILAKREEDNFGVNENFIHQMILDINSIIEQFEKSSDIQFTGVFKAQIAVNVCNKAVKNLEGLSEKFTRTHDPLVYLNSMKEEYFELFKHFCEGATTVTFFVRYLVKYLAKAALDAVPDKICITIVHERKSNTPAFSGNRSRLENYILNDLAKKEDFNLYMDYISDPQKVFREFITEHIDNYLACETQLQEMISATWSWFNKQIISASDSATAKLVEKQGTGNASIWLDEFCEKLGGYVTISRMDLKIIEREYIQDTAFLKNYFADFLNSTFNHESAKYEASFKSGPVLFKFRNRPDDILFKQMSGCWEQCPFCKAVCTNSIPDHVSDHFAHLHRPQFLGNLFNQVQEVPDEYWPEIQIKTENQFCLNFCTSSCSYKFFSAKSETWIPFRDYRKAGPPYNKWNMQGIEGLYWKWFVWTFRSDLEQYYGWKFEGFGEIPKEWGEITKAKALEELNVKG